MLHESTLLRARDVYSDLNHISKNERNILIQKAKRCLAWANDPARTVVAPGAENMTKDQVRVRVRDRVRVRVRGRGRGRGRGWGRADNAPARKLREPTAMVCWLWETVLCVWCLVKMGED